MSLPNDSNSENQFNLRQESNDEINPPLNGVDLNFNFQNENLLEHYQESIPENNHFYNNIFQNQNIQEENNYFDSTPKNTIDFAKIINQTSTNNKKEEELSDFDNIPEENENLSNSFTKISLIKTVHNNKEKKEEKEKKKKKEKKEKKEEKEEEKDSKTEKKLLGKKRGRRSKGVIYDDDSKIHSRTELGNMTRIILTAFVRNFHYFMQNYTNNKKLVQPTITVLYEKEDKKIRKLINSHEKMRKLVHQTVYTFYHDYAFPKNVSGSKKIEDALESEKNRLKKMKEYKDEVGDMINNEKNKSIKKSTAILDLEIIKLLDVFLDYGYESYDNKKIEIDENKYGFKYIDLQEFETYKQIRYIFSDDETKQNHYRTHLKKIIHD